MTENPQNDADAIGGILTAMYAAISGQPEDRDWAALSHLFHPDAQLVRTGIDTEGAPFALAFSISEYSANAEALLSDIPFYEIETARRIVRFGNVAQAFSAYEARPAPDAEALIKRGMNMLHLYNDGTGWTIMHMIWDDERKGVAIPPELFTLD